MAPLTRKEISSTSSSDHPSSSNPTGNQTAAPSQPTPMESTPHTIATPLTTNLKAPTLPVTDSPAPLPSVPRKARMKTVIRNAIALDQIRSALGPDRISWLPALDQLHFKPEPPARVGGSPHWLPICLRIGHYISPEASSAYTLLPVYAWADGMTMDVPHVYFGVVAEEPLDDPLSPELGILDVGGWTIDDQGWETFTSHVHFNPGFEAPSSWDEMTAQVRYCFLLAWEAKVPVDFTNSVPAFNSNLASLADIADRVKQNVEHLFDGADFSRLSLEPPAQPTVIRSFKAQLRGGGRTPPRPEYEPLSPMLQ